MKDTIKYYVFTCSNVLLENQIIRPAYDIRNPYLGYRQNIKFKYVSVISVHQFKPNYSMLC